MKPFAIVAFLITGSLFGPDDKVSTWNGFERRDFVVEGRACLLVVPKEAAPGKPWIWRTEFFGHEPQGDLALLGEGLPRRLYGRPEPVRRAGGPRPDGQVPRTSERRAGPVEEARPGRIQPRRTVLSELGGAQSGAGRLHL